MNHNDTKTQRKVAVFVTLWLCGSLAVLGQAPQVRIEGIFPRQLPRGQATVINVAIQNRDRIQSAEISPSTGVKVSNIKQGENFQGAYTWSEITIDVAPDAMPGDRTMVLVLPTGRTLPVTITIPNHVPKISDLRVLPAQSSLDVQFTVGDASADIANSPYVWYMAGCGGELFPGTVYGKMTNTVVRAGIPSTAFKGKCDLQVRLTDSRGIESNTLKTTVDFK